MRKIMAVTLALALAFSTTAWAGNGAKRQTRNKNMTGTCTQQKAPGMHQKRTGQTTGKHYGPGDGTGNKGEQPGDGTGYGKKAGVHNGTGECDGDGPHGKTLKKKTKKSKQGPGT